MLTLALALALGCPQRIRVVAPSLRSTAATVTFTQCGRRVFGPWPARVGYRGLSARHREGDGMTPLGTYAVGPVVYGLDPRPGGLRLRYHHLVCGDWWDEDSGSPTYNTFRHVPCGSTPPFGGGSEALWRATIAYRLFAVVEYNAARAPGRGSGIFLHVDTGHATNGCVSLPEPLLRRLLQTLRPGATISITAA